MDLANLSAPQELALAVSAGVTLLGVYLCWIAPRYRMSLEEHVKDGHVSEEKARKKIRMMGWLGPAVCSLGVGALAWLLVR